MNAPVAARAMALPEIVPAAPIVRLPFARTVKSPAVPPLMVALIATFLPALSVSELLLQFTAFETVMSDVLPIAVSVELPVVVQPVTPPTAPMVTAPLLVRFTAVRGEARKILQRSTAEAEPTRRITEIGVGTDRKRPGADRRAAAIGVVGGEGGRAGTHLHERAGFRR